MTDETLYLIAHKVRNQPAFDIAIQMPMEDEVWWIIPTSGHRAYPWWSIKLEDLQMGYYDKPTTNPIQVGWNRIDWQSYPDHYWQPGQTSDLIIPENAGSGLLAKLGINRPIAEPLKRRPL